MMIMAYYFLMQISDFLNALFSDWLIYMNEVFVGLFALCVAYWGNRIHRASWLGALTIFLAVACATLAVPEIYNPLSGSEIDSSITGMP